MHLPNIHADEWTIDYDSDGVEVGDTLYFAPDGTLMAVTNVSRRLIALRGLADNSTTTVHRHNVTDGLWTDYLPVCRA
jgi:hypothetical protein